MASKTHRRKDALLFQDPEVAAHVQLRTWLPEDKEGRDAPSAFRKVLGFPPAFRPPRRVDGMEPRQYFTHERVTRRTRADLPEVLFHFTRPERALGILQTGGIVGRPAVSMTENPAFVVPGPVVFVIDPKCVIDGGLEFWPFLWQRGAESEAEWVVAMPGAEFDRGLLFTKRVSVPVSCVTLVGYVGLRKPKGVEEAATDLGIPFEPFDWTEWWADGASRKRS